MTIDNNNVTAKLNERLSKSWDVITPFEEASVIEGRRWKLAYISIRSITLGRAARLMTSQGYHFCDICDLNFVRTCYAMAKLKRALLCT